MMGINYRTYHHAAELARGGEPFYDVPPPEAYDWAVYLYPPGTLPLYYPFTLVDWTTGFAIMTAISVLAALAATWLIVDYVESFGPALGWVDVALILLALLLSTHVFGTVYFGNVNLLLALGLVFGFWALLRERETASGVAFGAVALFKVFPALVGLWLLRERRFRAVGAAIVTGVAGLAVGLVVFGFDTTTYYLTNVLSGRTETSEFVGGYPVSGTYYVTIQQPLSRLVATVWPSAPYEVILLLAILLTLSVLAYFYRDIRTPIERQMAIFVTLAAMVTLFPSLRWYLVFLYLPMVALLYLWTEGHGRLLFLAGGVLFSITFSAESVVDALDGVPEPLYSVGYALGGSAVLPMYGILLMVAACVWYKERSLGTD